MSLRRAGHEVLTSTVRWPELAAPLAALRDAGATVRLRDAGTPPLLRRIARRMARLGSSELPSDRDWRDITGFRPDLVCVSHGAFECGLDWMERCLADGIPYASIAQANAEIWWPDDGAASRLRAAYRGARRAFFVSRANLDLFERQIGERLNHAEVVWGACHATHESNPPWPDDSAGMHLACVARLDPKAKGQDLIAAVLAMPKWRARDLSVTLYGSGGSPEGLRRLAAMEGVSGRLKIGGYMQDIESLWAHHHALLLPSRYEGLPLAILEAMLCARPCIVTDVAGNREPLEDNVTGFIAASPTVAHLDEAMERAWQRRHDWQAMGCAAAAAIRAVMPEDPAGVLAQKLTELVE
jgi:glycosyltransferase involved in cell wall biosynthesis